MPKIKLTEKVIKSLVAPTATGKEIIYWDDDLKGFGLKCSGKTNVRTYIVQRDLADGRTRRLTVGAANLLSVEKARQDASEKLLDLIRGKDPKVRKKEQETLQDWLDKYLETNTKLSSNTADDYRSLLELHLESWLDLPLPSITPDMVEAHHHSIAEKISARNKNVRNGAMTFSGQATANRAMRVLRIIWNFAAERLPDLPRSPTVRLKRQWFASPRRERMVKADDLPAFYAAVTKLPNQIARDAELVSVEVLYEPGGLAA